MEKDTLVLPSLSPVGDKPIMIDARCTSADGGVLLFQDVERRLNLANRLAACLHDPRQPGKITHPLDEILRLLAIVAGYPDGNDVLRDDPAFKMALRRFRGRRSAHSPPAWRTCRGARNSIAWRCSTCIATAFRLCPIISPLISTRASIGASRNYASSTPITMTGASCRSTSSTPAAGVRAAGGGDAERDPDAGQAGDIRERFPRVRIRLRGDSHYACPEVMTLRSLCDRVQRTRKRGCAAGATPPAWSTSSACPETPPWRPGSRRSKRARGRDMPRAARPSHPSSSSAVTRTSGAVLELPAPDRVEAGPDGVDTRYIVTNLRRAQGLYERKYCQRGRTC
jgi:Transposase DDE domain group 1